MHACMRARTRKSCLLLQKFIKGKVQSKDNIENVSMKERKIIKQAWAKIGIELDPEEQWSSSASKYYFHKGIITSLWGNNFKKSFKNSCSLNC